MIPKLLALDLDGTLIHEDLVILPRAKEVLAEARRRGVDVVLATGRMFEAALPFATELNLSGPLISAQGAFVRDIATGGVLYYQPVPQDIAHEFIRDIQQRGHHLHIYVGDDIYAEHDSPEGRFYATLSRKEMRITGDLLAMLNDSEGHTTTKICVVAAEETTTALVAEMSARYKGRLHVTRSYATFTEAVHPSVSKGAALAALAEQRGLARSEIMAIGDNLNDLEMVQFAGIGVAVANAHPQTKAAAVYVCKGEVAEGVVEAVEKFILITP